MMVLAYKTNKNWVLGDEMKISFRKIFPPKNQSFGFFSSKVKGIEKSQKKNEKFLLKFFFSATFGPN